MSYNPMTLSYQNYYPPIKPLGIIVLALALFSGCAYYAGIRINFDSSHDTVFWRVSKPTPQRDSYVIICFPTSFVVLHQLQRHFSGQGRCGGIMPLLKKIVATENDIITINENGIRVNEAGIEHSRPLSQLVRITDQKTKVPKGKILIAGQTEDSLDSRYFGLVDVQWIEYSATPLF